VKFAFERRERRDQGAAPEEIHKRYFSENPEEGKQFKKLTAVSTPGRRAYGPFGGVEDCSSAYLVRCGFVKEGFKRGKVSKADFKVAT
jgi:hypothetical protein